MTNEISNEQNTINDTFVKLHNLYFTTTLVSIVDLVNQTSVEYCEKKGKKKNHENLQKTCNDILVHYKNKDKNDNNNDNNGKSNLSERKIILKIYSVMRINTDLLIKRSHELFDLKDENKNMLTIIPGCDIGLVYKKLKEDDAVRLWKLLSVLFITVTRLVHSLCGDKIKTKYKDIINNATNQLTKQLLDEGVDIEKMLFNPFLGLGNDNDNGDGKGICVDDLFNQITSSLKEGQNGTGIESLMNIEYITKTLGVNIDDIDKDIREKCKDITDEEIESVSGQISEFFGGKGDNDVKEVCGTLVKHVIKDVRDNGIRDMLNNGKNKTFENVEKELGKKKLKKVAKKMHKVVQNKNIPNMGKGGNILSGFMENIMKNKISGDGLFKKSGK
jgi:hypothetical protein